MNPEHQPSSIGGHGPLLPPFGGHSGVLFPIEENFSPCYRNSKMMPMRLIGGLGGAPTIPTTIYEIYPQGEGHRGLCFKFSAAVFITSTLILIFEWINSPSIQSLGFVQKLDNKGGPKNYRRSLCRAPKGSGRGSRHRTCVLLTRAQLGS